MMGNKTAKEIREELQRAFEAEGKDPLAWLEQRMATGGKSDTLESLYNFMKRHPTKKKRARKAAAKK